MMISIKPHQFKVGQKVRCVSNQHDRTFVDVGCQYVVTSISPDGKFLRFNDKNYGHYAFQFEPVSDIHEGRETAYDKFVRLCNNPPEPNDALRELLRNTQWPSGAHNAPVVIPETAKKILGLKPEKPVDPRSAGIARAVDRLSHYEPRLGCHEFQP